jgi:hypothetical protein
MKFYPPILRILLITGCSLSAKYIHAQNISGTINFYYKVTAINVASSTLTLSSTAGLYPGTKVMLIQMKGATIDVSNTSTFGNITAINNTGNYEINNVCSVSGNDVLLKFAILKTYSVGGLVQLVTIPRYTDAIVTGTLNAQTWNATSGTGGVIALESTNSLTLLASIDASGAGFNGATYLDFPIPPNDCNFLNNISDYVIPNPTVNVFANGDRKGEGIAAGNASIELGRGKLANGGGGGNNHNSGGAGGSNYGTGGSGGQRSNEGAANCHGQYPGIGGVPLQSNGYSSGTNKIFLGGGGGAGHGNNDVGMHGANGGGIVVILTNTLIGNNNLISANGNQPYRAGLADPLVAGGDGGGGGGGGGVVILNANTYSGNVIVQANGGRGSDASNAPSSGCFGPGGGGGGGVIWVKGASVDPLVSTSVAGGGNGFISINTSVVACRGLANGASTGTNGAVITNYSLPAASSLLCMPLPLNDLEHFTSKQTISGIELNWKMRTIQHLIRFELERSDDQNNFSTLAMIGNNHNYNYDYADEKPSSGSVYYRLKLVYDDGRIGYSPVLAVKAAGTDQLQLLHISPNPVKDITQLLIQTGRQVHLTTLVYNAVGQKIIGRNDHLQKGIHRLALNLQSLEPGLYFIRIMNEDQIIVQSIMKSR